MSEVLQGTPQSLEVMLPRASRSSPSAGAQSRPRICPGVCIWQRLMQGAGA